MLFWVQYQWWWSIALSGLATSIASTSCNRLRMPGSTLSNVSVIWESLKFLLREYFALQYARDHVGQGFEMEEHCETGATNEEEDEDLSWDVDEEKEAEEHVAPSETVAEGAELTEAFTSARSIEVPVAASTEGKVLFEVSKSL